MRLKLSSLCNFPRLRVLLFICPVIAFAFFMLLFSSSADKLFSFMSAEKMAANREIADRHHSSQDPSVRTISGGNGKQQQLELMKPPPNVTGPFQSLLVTPEAKRIAPKQGRPPKNATFVMLFRNVVRKITVSRPEFGSCPESGTEILIVVPSAVRQFEHRDAIRRSWAANMPPEVRVYFIVGRPTEEVGEPQKWETLRVLRKEHQQFGDLIETDIDDVYENLHFKTYAIFRWKEEFCKSAKYLLKIDDDSTVEVSRLLYWIRRKFDALAGAEPERLVGFGSLIADKEPIRNKSSKWYVSESVFPGEVYPTYLNGPIYLLTAESVSAILSFTMDADLMPMEDVMFTGILRETAGVKLIEATEHIRTYGWVYSVEKCSEPETDAESPTPFVAALNYAGATPETIAEDYALIQGLKCQKRFVAYKENDLYN